MLGSHSKINKYILPILAWCVLCSCVLFFATTSRFSFQLINDKVTHASVFCTLLIVLGGQAKDLKKLVAVSIGLFLVGCGIEFVQTWVPQRHSSGADVLANTIGLACGVSVVILSRVTRLPALVFGNSSNALRALRRFD